MNPMNPSQGKGQPTLAELMSGYLQRQTEAHAAGLATFDLSGEVQPYEAGPVQAIDARPAWEEAITLVKLAKADNGSKSLKAPPGWPTVVAALEPAYDLAMSLGNFPQMVRNLHPLLNAKDLSELRKSALSRPVEVPNLNDWAEQVSEQGQFPQLLLAVGALRLAKQYDLAARLIEKNEDAVPEQWRALWDNEKAALAWHRGEVEHALRQWQAQPESVPVLFNRGMAALFLNRSAEARDSLTRAVAQLPESSAWHHLARLYLTLAESRS